MATRSKEEFDPPQFFPYRPETFCLLRLPVQGIKLAADLTDDITDPEQILLCGFHLFKGNLLAGFVFCDTGSLFNKKAAFLRFCHQDHPDPPLLDNRVGPGTDTGIHEKLGNIHKTTGGSVEQIVAFAIPVEPACYLNF